MSSRPKHPTANLNIISEIPSKKTSIDKTSDPILDAIKAEHSTNQLSPAKLSINQFGTPESLQYGDVYYSNDHGIKETEYVFIEGNALLTKWENAEQASFCIAETGFGTGLNFFVVANAFQKFRQNNPGHQLRHLHFISTEKHPIDKQDVASILASWPQFERHTNSWLAQYPLAIPGVHRREIDNNVTLDLYYGDASDAFNHLAIRPEGIVDAWFLDGFAPSKNKSMWHPQLFCAMARVSKQNATLATFTAAGFVKRGLIEAGFTMSKRKGFGHKRDMLIGYLPSREHIEPQVRMPNKYSAPYFVRNCRQSETQTKTVTIIGNGLAGAILAYKLCKQGYAVKLLWEGDAPADGASGAPIGGFYPQLNAQNNTASQVQLHSFLYASTFYKSLLQEHRFEHAWCGALQLGFNENTQTRLLKMQEGQFWPKEVASIVNSAQATEIANIDIPYSALFIPEAGWISPNSLVCSCLQAAKDTGLLTMQSNTKLRGFKSIPNNNGQQIELRLQQMNSPDIVEAKRTTEHAETLIIAAGYGSQQLLKESLPLRTTRGQIELVQSCEPFSKLSTLLCHKGYFTPEVNGIHALGSTYIKEDFDTQVRASETRQNFELHEKSMAQATWLKELKSMQNIYSNSRASIRCASPDHLPVVGALHSQSQYSEFKDLYKAFPVHKYPMGTDIEGVYILTGLGSRGLTTAPLMAELLISQIQGRALPVRNELANALNPNRFLVRELIRRQP
jgi:tRNA 5-methylaminomethyl-2-thiouridine biosynthesis bifunctional protein